MWNLWERREKCKRFWWEDQGVDGSMESEWILGRLPGGCGFDSAGSA
jgi:hypothetical protein